MASASPSKPPIALIIGVCALCCLVSASAGAGVYAISSSSGDSSSPAPDASSSQTPRPTPSPTPGPAPSPTPGPAPSPTPGSKATILSGAQALQTAEIDISTSPPAFNMPTGLMTSVTYTMSMDINIAQASIRWRSIFNSGNPDCCGPSTRHPAVYITGTQDAPPANRVRVVHAWDGNPDPGGPTTFAATPGTYFNLTWVVSGNALKTYINGSLDSTLVSASGTFNWNTPSNAWKWNSYLPDPSGANGNAAGPLKVKNVYWWNRALTAAEVATIGSSTTSTTSGYAVEPYTVSGLKTY